MTLDFGRLMGVRFLLASMNSQLALGLPAVAPSDTVVINARCTLRTEGDQRVVVVAGLPVYHYCAVDAVAEAYAMVMLVDSGFAQQNEVARAFERAERTVRRHQERYAEAGMVGLGRPQGWRQGRRRISGKRLRLIERLKGQGLSNRAVAQRLGVSEMAIRKLVGPSRGEGLEQLPLVTRAVPVASELPAAPEVTVLSVTPVGGAAEPEPIRPAQDSSHDSAPVEDHDEDPEPVPMSLDRDAGDRSGDRQMAYLGLLADAAPMFREGERVAGAGALLAVPFLVQSGLLHIARKVYGGIGPAFYGLRTTLVTLFLMALLRIQRPEQLKERDPAAFGRLLGLDRAPEVKTLRRALSRLAAHHCARQMGAELARVRVAQRGGLMGFLYIDGHVRAYHGKHTISKAFVARRHLAMPAATDYWINDRAGDPLLLITGELDASLTKAFPDLLREVRAAVGERQVTIVFDRGGWSPKLFRSMIAQGFDLLTYRKGKARRITERRIVHRRAKLDGHWVSYDLHDQPVRLLGGKLRLRQITRLCEDRDHQTQIITSRWDLRDIELAYLRELQRRHHLAVLVVHHAKKGAGHVRAGQALRGSSEFHAWGDSNLYLRRLGNELTLTIEHRAARSPPPVGLELTQRGEALALELRAQAPSEISPPASVDERIVSTLSQCGRPVPAAELRALCAVRKATFYARLLDLTRAGRLTRSPEGYRLATTPA